MGLEMCEGMMLFHEVGGDVGVGVDICAAEGEVGTPPMQAIISISVSSSSSTRGSVCVSDDEGTSGICPIPLSVTATRDSGGSDPSSSEGEGVKGESGNDSSNCASEGYRC
jgi:hypothetical protein